MRVPSIAREYPYLDVDFFLPTVYDYPIELKEQEYNNETRRELRLQP